MSISGYSTLHDPEVQMWKAARAEYKALKRQEEEERRQRELAKLGPDAQTAGWNGSNGGRGGGKGLLRRMLGGGKQQKKVGVKGRSGPQARKVVDEREGEDGEEWLSDADTEIDMAQALQGGREG